MDQANIFELEAEGSNDIQALLGSINSINSINSNENINYQNFMGMGDMKGKSFNDGGDLQSLISEIKNEKEAEGE